MIVESNDFGDVLQHLYCYKGPLAFDTETTGLRRFHGDKLFSLAIATTHDEFYFNFNYQNEGDILNGSVPLDPSRLVDLAFLFSDDSRLWIAANAKFDLHMLDQEGITVNGKVYDVLVMARLLRNDFMRYSLAACAERIGLVKSSEVDVWIKTNKAYKKTKIPGKKGEVRNPLFWYVPLEIISKYACTDVRITLNLYIQQMGAMEAWDLKHPKLKSIFEVCENEMALTKVCFDMEKTGMKIDVPFVSAAIAHETAIMEEAKKEFLEHSKTPLIDSNKALKAVFQNEGIEAGVTEKGNDSYTYSVLENSDNTLAKILLKFRDANKKVSSYFSSFLYHADKDGIIHCNIRQSATSTGRFSISDPALQTLNSDDDADTEWKVRRSFVPRASYTFLAVDYCAFEFRAMLDTAGEKDLAAQIEAGLDPHQATADLVGITRKQAKTINFGLLYGMGNGKLGIALGVPVEEAARLKRIYFDKLPKVEALIRKAAHVASLRTYVCNRFGRPYHFIDQRFAYKALNALIQGGTADAVKFAMVRLHELLAPYKTRMVLQIHDEILFELHESEHHLVSKIVRIMEDAWPETFHKMQCSTETGKSWGDLEKYVPEA